MPFELNAAVTIYKIYSDNKITKINVKKAKKAIYIYYDSSMTEHKIGKLKTKEVNNIYHYSSKKYGDTKVKLIDINDLINYSSKTVSFEL